MLKVALGIALLDDPVLARTRQSEGSTVERQPATRRTGNRIDWQKSMTRTEYFDTLWAA